MFAAALFAVFVWYLSTGVILVLDGLAPRTFRWSMLAMTAAAAAAYAGLSVLRDDASVFGAYAGFTCGIVAWAWQEMAFLMGFVTGPRPRGCAADCRGWAHFAYAVQAVLYHELAIAAGAGLIAWVCWGGVNQVGCWTFMILWGMRQSAKLNVFLGVRNLSLEFLPPHLEFLKSYLICKPMNLLFPVSVTAGTVLALVLAQRTAAADSAFGLAGLTFLTTMTILALVEHWFLMLPVPFARLWDWWLAARRKPLTPTWPVAARRPAVEPAHASAQTQAAR